MKHGLPLSHDDRRAPELPIAADGQVGKCRNQGQREVVDAEIAEVLERSNRVGLPRPGQAGHDDEARERSWPVSGLPLLIEEQDWAAISAGITQRAEIFERLLADVYGPAELVKDGVPPAAITVQGFGDTHLLVPTGAGVREPQNRRVEIIVR